MADSVIERLVVAIGFKVDKSSAASAKATHRNLVAGFTAASTAIAGATAAAFGWTVAQAEADSETAKLAHSLGFTTDAFTSMELAMQALGGVSRTELAPSLRQAQTQLEAFARGSGEAAPWLKKLGIDAKSATGGVQSIAKVLPELADNWDRLTKDEQQAAALRIFGESGAKIGLALSQGTEAIKELQREADRLGYTLTEESAKNAEELSDAMGELHAAGTGLSRMITGELTPKLTPLVKGFTEWLTESDGIVKLGLHRVVQGIGFAFDALDTPLGRAGAGIVALGAGAGALKMGFGAASLAASGLGISLGGVATAAAPWVLVFGGLALVLEDLWVTAQGGDSVTRRLADAFGVGEEVAKGLRDTIDMTGEALQAFSTVGSEAIDVAWSMVPSMESLSGAVDLARAAFATFNPGIEVFGAYFEWDPWKTPLGRFLSWLSNTFNPAKALSGFQKLNRFMAGDEGVRRRTNVSGNLLSSTPLGGLALRSRQRRMGREGAGLRDEMDIVRRPGLREGPSITVAPSVNVTADFDRSEVVREALFETERQLHAGFDAVGAM